MKPSVAVGRNDSDAWKTSPVRWLVKGWYGPLGPSGKPRCPSGSRSAWLSANSCCASGFASRYFCQMRSTLLWCIQKTGWKEDWYEAKMPPTKPCIELCGASTDGWRDVWKRVDACTE